MERGTVIWFDVAKGYGYIRRDGGGPDLLVTLCAVERAEMASLTEGQRLGFEVVNDSRLGRACAENISIVLGPSVVLPTTATPAHPRT
jgi:CspA family cold shock protein